MGLYSQLFTLIESYQIYSVANDLSNGGCMNHIITTDSHFAAFITRIQSMK